MASIILATATAASPLTAQEVVQDTLRIEGNRAWLTHGDIHVLEPVEGYAVSYFEVECDEGIMRMKGYWPLLEPDADATILRAAELMPGSTVRQVFDAICGTR